MKWRIVEQWEPGTRWHMVAEVVDIACLECAQELERHGYCEMTVGVMIRDAGTPHYNGGISPHAKGWQPGQLKITHQRKGQSDWYYDADEAWREYTGR